MSARLEVYRRVVLLGQWFVGTRDRRRRSTGGATGKRERLRAFPAWRSVHQKDDGRVPDHDRVLDQTTSVLRRGGPRQPADTGDKEHGACDTHGDAPRVVAERRQRGRVGELDLKVDERALAAGWPKRRKAAVGSGGKVVRSRGGDQEERIRSVCVPLGAAQRLEFITAFRSGRHKDLSLSPPLCV